METWIGSVFIVACLKKNIIFLAFLDTDPQSQLFLELKAWFFPSRCHSKTLLKRHISVRFLFASVVLNDLKYLCRQKKCWHFCSICNVTRLPNWFSEVCETNRFAFLSGSVIRKIWAIVRNLRKTVCFFKLWKDPKLTRKVVATPFYKDWLFCFCVDVKNWSNSSFEHRTFMHFLPVIQSSIAHHIFDGVSDFCRKVSWRLQSTRYEIVLALRKFRCLFRKSSEVRAVLPILVVFCLFRSSMRWHVDL